MLIPHRLHIGIKSSISIIPKGFIDISYRDVVSYHPVMDIVERITVRKGVTNCLINLEPYCMKGCFLRLCFLTFCGLARLFFSVKSLTFLAVAFAILACHICGPTAALKEL